MNGSDTYLVQTFVNSPKQMQPLAQHANAKTNFDVLCQPFFAIYKAAAPPGGVHLFILDADGLEKQVLDTIPWNKVDIPVNIFLIAKIIHILKFLKYSGLEKPEGSFFHAKQGF